jgi:hypothetical protein
MSEEASQVHEQDKNADPVRLMALAFDRVVERLPATTERTTGMDREIALFIVDHYRLGEHDPDRLSDLALAKLSPDQGSAVSNQISEESKQEAELAA